MAPKRGGKSRAPSKRSPQPKRSAPSTRAPQSPRPASPTGWTVSGDVHVASEPPGTVASFEELGGRFVVEEDGYWTTASPRPALAIGMGMASGVIESEAHAHREAQLMYLVRGEMICEASSALWIVPPQSALWIPSSVTHKIRARAPLEGYSVFVEPGAAPNLPADCCAVSVTPLFRELLLRLASRPPLYDLDGPEARLVGVLLDELATVAIENHRLPMPTDPRLRRLVDAMTADPASPATAATWARRIGVGERTLSRLLVEETGLGFARWRQQLHIVLAIQKLSRGATVQSVALDLGYEGASSFVTMFKRVMGSSPARYMASRLAAPVR